MENDSLILRFFLILWSDSFRLIVLLGIVRWGDQIQRILDDGELLLQQTRTQDITAPITVLLEGE